MGVCLDEQVTWLWEKAKLLKGSASELTAPSACPVRDDNVDSVVIGISLGRSFQKSFVVWKVAATARAPAASQTHLSQIRAAAPPTPRLLPLGAQLPWSTFFGWSRMMPLGYDP